MINTIYHTPVLLDKCIEGLNINPTGTYVDVTFGGGGHSREILKHLTTGRLIAFDQDEEALKNTIDDERFTLIISNFSFLKNFLRLYNISSVDGVFADLGVSSHQLDTAERGFSTRFDSTLDLRMSTKNPLTAQNVVNTYEHEELKRVFKIYGELNNAHLVANAIIKYRTLKSINTTVELKEAVVNLCPRHKQNKFLAQLFQALRIEVNKEMEALRELLQQSQEMLVVKGRLVVLSYHSLEDRLVKNFMRSGNFEGVVDEDFFGNRMGPFELITRKPIIPDEAEVLLNNRSRSAKLRIAQKK